MIGSESDRNDVPAKFSEQSPEAIRDFLLLAPRSPQLREIMHRVPRRDGFREGHERQFRYQFLEIAKALGGRDAAVSQARATSTYRLLWQLIVDNRLSRHWSRPKPLTLEKGSVDELLLRISSSDPIQHTRDEVRDVLNFAPFELPDDLESELELLPKASDFQISKRLQRLEDQLGALVLAVDADALSADHASLALVRDDLDRLNAAVSSLNETIATRKLTGAEPGDDSVEKLTRIVDEFTDSINRRISELADEHAQMISAKLGAELPHDLAMRVEALEAAAVSGVASKQGSDSNKTDAKGRQQQAELWEPRRANVKARADATFEEIVDAPGLHSILTSAFELVGLSRTDAARCGLSVAAAVLGSRWITFHGSLAIELGEAVVRAISSSEYTRVYIPVGCLMPIPRTNGNESAIVLGADRAPVDVYGGEYRRRTMNRIRGKESSDDPIVVAVCEGGEDALKIGEGLAALGPVIATDALRWTASSKKGEPRRGNLSAEVRKIVARPLSADDLGEGLVAAFGMNALWGLALKRFVGALKLVGCEDQHDWAIANCFVAPLVALSSGIADSSVPIPGGEDVSRVVSRLRRH